MLGRNSGGWRSVLLFQQTAMAGDTEPPAILKYPGVGEATEMFVGLGGVETLGVIGAGNDGGGRVNLHFHIVDTHDAWLKFGIGKIRQKLAPVANLSVVFRIDEFVADHPGD